MKIFSFQLRIFYFEQMRTLSYERIAQMLIKMGIFNQKMCFSNCKMDVGPSINTSHYKLII